MDGVPTPPGLYAIRIRGQLGATALSAFPSMVSELKGSETVLTGLLEDRSALYRVLAQIEALGLELLELRQIRARPTLPESGVTAHRLVCEPFGRVHPAVGVALPAHDLIPPRNQARSLELGLRELRP
jgi:hypothetical protein